MNRCLILILGSVSSFAHVCRAPGFPVCDNLASGIGSSLVVDPSLAHAWCACSKLAGPHTKAAWVGARACLGDRRVHPKLVCIAFSVKG